MDKTWSLVDLLVNKNAIDCKWVYKIKYKFNGSIEHYKAQLFVKGYSQQKGLNFHETFAFVAKLITINALLVVASIQN